jgi:RHS repeat-associated protein
MLAAEQDADVFPLAAFCLLAENPHRGHRLPTAARHRGFTPTNSNTATGFQAFLYDSGRRSRSTGKERDAETGLDYFGARYFSGAEGRFTSPDWADKPEPVPFANLSDPQTLNLYGYVRNNPLSKADPDGHCGLIPLTCKSAGEFFSSLPDRVTGGLKGEANLFFGANLKPSNDEQADAMNVVKQDGPTIIGYGAMVLPGPKGEIGEVGEYHAPGDVPSGNVVVRGGATELPPPGQTFSGAQGATTAEAAAGVPHGQIRETTAGAIRDGGGTVRPSPELTRSGNVNGQHVNVTEGAGSTFGPVKPNPVPKKERIQ